MTWKGDRQHKSYGGLRHSAEKLIKFIPEHELYVEPFAGHGYVWQRLGKPDNAVLGDINCEAIQWLEKNRGQSKAKMKCQDWRKTVKQTDSKNTLFLFDPPWKECYSKYKGNCRLWGPEIIEIAKGLKGKSRITLSDTPENREILCKPPLKCKRIHSDFPGCKTKEGKTCKIKLIIGIKD